jgi:acetyltransferase-like isoleucine patch superfamily enzyme
MPSIQMFLQKLGRAWRLQKLRASGAKVGRGLQSFDDFFAGEAKGFVCDSGIYLSAGCKILIAKRGDRTGKLTIGRNVYVNHYTIIDCHYSISIGNSVLIGPHCYICDYDHGVEGGLAVAAQPEGHVGEVSIGEDVWIGAGVIILKGVTVGRGAVIGAGSVVTHDVTAMSVVVGNPAQLLRMR